MKNTTILLSCFLLFVMFTSSCNKHTTTDPAPTTPTTSSDSLYVVRTSKMGSVKDTVQATLYPASRKGKITYYGSFNSDGNPDIIKRMAIAFNNTGDSVLNLMLDDNGQVRSMFVSVNGKNDSCIAYFKYSGDTITTHYFKVNWATGKQTLIYEASYKSKGKNSTLIDTASFGGRLEFSFSSLCTNANIAAFTTALILAVAAPVVAEVLLGYAIDQALVATAALLGPMFITSIENVIKEKELLEIQGIDLPLNFPKDPQTQAQQENPLLLTNEIYTGTTESSPISSNYGVTCPSPFTDWCRFNSIKLDLSLNTGDNSISFAFASAKFTEYSSTAPVNQLIQPNYHRYPLQIGSFNGQSVSLNFSQEAGNPGCKAQFYGTRTADAITGTLTIYRSDGIPCIAFSVPISMKLDKLN